MGLGYALLVVAHTWKDGGERVSGSDPESVKREVLWGCGGTLTLNLLMSFCPGEGLYADGVELRSSTADSSKVLVMAPGERSQASGRKEGI